MSLALTASHTTRLSSCCKSGADGREQADSRSRRSTRVEIDRISGYRVYESLPETGCACNRSKSAPLYVRLQTRTQDLCTAHHGDCIQQGPGGRPNESCGRTRHERGVADRGRPRASTRTRPGVGEDAGKRHLLYRRTRNTRTHSRTVPANTGS